MSTDEKEFSETPVLKLIQSIQSGEVDPSSLNKEERQRCIEVLRGEGYWIPEIAQILGRHERTIKRDFEEIRERNKLSPNPELAKQIIGEMVQLARLKQVRLDRLAKSKEIEAIERGQLEYMSWRVCKDVVESLQSLGYLPLRPQEIVGDIFHHSDNNPIKSLEEVQAIVSEVQAVAERAG